VSALILLASYNCPLFVSSLNLLPMLLFLAECVFTPSAVSASTAAAGGVDIERDEDARQQKHLNTFVD